MRNRFIILVLKIVVIISMIANNVFAQKKIPNKFDKSIVLADTSLLYVKHIKSIYKHDGIGFLDHMIKYYLDTIADIKYITNRKMLHEIPLVKKDTLSFVFKDQYLDNDYEIVLTKQKFRPEMHKLERQSSGIDTFKYAQIDDQIAYGANYPIENTYYEIGDISVKINNRKISIPNKEFSNLLSPWFGIYDPFFNTDKLYNGVNVWASIDGHFVYIYIFGGTGGIDTYSAKLIFSKDEYITRFVVDYAPLTKFATFRNDFIGF